MKRLADRDGSLSRSLALLCLAWLSLPGCGTDEQCSCTPDSLCGYLLVHPPTADGESPWTADDLGLLQDLRATPPDDLLDPPEQLPGSDALAEIQGEEEAFAEELPPPCPEGTACNPLPVDQMPFHDGRNGVDGPADEWNFYSPCAPEINESGPEWVYLVTVAEAGVLHAKLDESLESDAVDMDVHILSAPSPGSCLARGHYHASYVVEPGQYWVVVDSWTDKDGVSLPGPYGLDLYMTKGSLLPEGAGFNKYVIEAINDWTLFPKDGTYPYCFQNASCEPDFVDIYFGMIHDSGYLGQTLFEGTQRCYCCGHTLEVFLDAYRRYQLDKGLAVTVPYGDLTLADVDIGPFYQHWFGFGVAKTSSSANALEYAGIGINLKPTEWELAQTGDMLNLSRSNGTGHSVIFVKWVKENGKIVGLRYYSCNGGGHSHPDPDDPDNKTGISGPSYATEYFNDYGGKVLPGYVFIGRAFSPDEL